jgi:uncharacterized protein (TIGR02271 family)
MMTGQKINDQDKGIVVGLFHSQADAESAIARLKQSGFSENQIGVALKDRKRQEELIEGTGTQAAEGAATGALGGGVLGGVIGLLAGVGALAIPGVGPIIAGGTLASTLAGAGIGAAAGGLIGALAGMGVPEEDARHFDQGFQAGGTLITVDAGARAAEARDCLYESGADLGSQGRGIAASANSVSGGSMRDTGEDSTRLELREEELRTEKERVQAGEVRLRKEVVTEQRTIEVPVTREEVVIERRPAVAGQEAGGSIGEGQEIRIPIMEEEVRVEKTPVVREEVSLKKRQVQDTERVSETVRREEARIEESGGTGGRDTEAWRGNERRYRHDSSYSGPERRVARV